MFLKLNPRQLTFCLSITLLIKASRSLAQEDYGSYLHEFYREEDHRMSIDTDTAGFDIGLGSHVRLQGQLVLDSISGATPTGAPPPNQWQFLSFNSYYKNSYNQLFQAAINDPNNYALYTGGYFANYQAYTNYIAQNNPQLASQATNAAVSQYHTLTNNPLFHSSKVPLTELHDLRRAASFSVPLSYDIHQLTPQVSISKESDYHSYGFALDYAVQLYKKNTTLNIGWSHDSDRVRDDTLVNWQGKVSDDILIGINQLISPKSYLTVNITYGQEYGYLNDPYRSVMIEVPGNDAYAQTDLNGGGSLYVERRPRSRNKQILYASYTQFVDPANGSAEVSYRFFHDSFGVFANTLDLAWHQKIWKNFIFTPAFRYYNQTAANFYYAYVLVPDPSLIPNYYSADYRLSELQSFNMSATLTYRIEKHVSVDLSYSRYIMEGLDGTTSQSAYPTANVYTIGGRVWF